MALKLLYITLGRVNLIINYYKLLLLLISIRISFYCEIVRSARLYIFLLAYLITYLLTGGATKNIFVVIVLMPFKCSDWLVDVGPL